MEASAGTAYVDFKGDFSTLSKQVAAFVGPLTSKFGKLGTAGAAGLGVVTGGAVAAGAALYDVGDQFDQAYDIIRVKTGDTGKELGVLKHDFEGVVQHVPVEFKEAGTAIGELNQRIGLTGKPLEKVAEQELELSRLTETELSPNIAATARLFADWSVKTNEQPKALNKLWRASQATGIEIGKLSEYMVQFGSPLRQMGFDFDTAAAMFSKFEKEGVNLQTAMPGLRMALKNFAKDGKEPARALEATIAEIKNAPTVMEANTKAFEIFGTRAGPDLAAAIREGRFDFASLIKTIDSGRDTILGAAHETDDFTEKWQIFKNKVMVGLEPLANQVFGAVSDEMERVSSILTDPHLSHEEKFSKLFHLISDQAGDALSEVASKAGHYAPVAAESFVHGFIETDIWGKLAIGGLVVTKMGGLGAFGKLGSKSGRAYGAGFVAALLGIELGKQVKTIIEGHKLDAPDSETFSMYLQEYFNVDAAKIIAPNQVEVATALGKLIFNSQTEKVVRAQGQKLQRFVGKVPEQIIVEFEHLRRINHVFASSLGPLPGKAHSVATEIDNAFIPKLDQLVNQGGKKGEAFAGRVGSSFSGLASLVKGALGNIGVNVDSMLDHLGTTKGSKYQLKEFVASLPELKPWKKEAGGIVPGHGDGDRPHPPIPAGSFVLNREATAALGLNKGGLVPVELEAGERWFHPDEVQRIGQGNLEVWNAAFPRRLRDGGAVGLDHPQILGPEPLRSLGQGGINEVFKAAVRYVEQHHPKGGPGYSGPAIGPAGTSTYKGVLMATWVRQALEAAAQKGVEAQPTSGYRPGPDPHTATGASEHQGTQYPRGAVDFGGFVDPAAAVVRDAVVAATRNFKYPLLHPVGFHDDGHASGTGHQLGGLVQALVDGGKVKPHGPPLFHGEGPAWYGRALRHNLPWAVGAAPWETALTPKQEDDFRDWLRGNPDVSWGWHVNQKHHDYDMRGYWLALASKGRGDVRDGHFPDAWKTPYDTAFSKWSKYAKPGTPFDWRGDWLVDLRTGQEIVSGKFAKGGSVTSQNEDLHKKAQRIWEVAAPYYGQTAGSTAPPVVGGHFRHAQEAETVHAGFDGAKRSEVKFGPALVKALLSGKGNLRNLAEETLLHEWAHYFQPPTGQKEWEFEGGAEAFARNYAPRIYEALKVPYATPRYSGYPEFERRVIKEKGWDWVDHGQFKQLGGLVQALIKGGGVLTPYEWGEAMLRGGFPPNQGDIAAGLGTIKSESNFDASQQAQGPSGHIGGWAESPAFGSVADRLDPIRSSAAAYREWKKDGGFWQAWGQWEAEQSGLSGGGAGTYGPEYMDTAKKVIEKGGGSSDAHTFKEDVPATYHGCRTDSLSFGSMPKSLKGVNAELAKRRGEVRHYRAAAAAAKKENKPAIEQALRKNITALEARITQLEHERAKLRRDAAKRKFTKHLGKKLARLTGWEELIEGKERAYDIQSQFAEQLVDLEPLAPELPASATDAVREAAEKQHVTDLTGYIEGRERPAYQHLLDLVADWRNTILLAENAAAGHWVKGQGLGGLEGRWEDQVVSIDDEIDRIGHLRDAHTDKWWNEHPKAKQHLEEQLNKVPLLRFKDRELRKSLGEARDLFYPGSGRVQPPAFPLAGSGSFEEALTNVQGIHWPDQHELLAHLPALRAAGAFGGAIWDVQTSIGELGLKISEANASLEGSSGGGSNDDSERVALLEELLRHEREERAVRSIEERVLGALPPYAGKAHTGAVVPGLPTEEKTMIVRGRERIRTPEQEVALAGAIREATTPAAAIAAGGPPVIEHLTIHADGSATMRYQGEEFEAAVRKVTHKDSRREARGASRRLARPGLGV